MTETPATFENKQGRRFEYRVEVMPLDVDGLGALGERGWKLAHAQRLGWVGPAETQPHRCVFIREIG